MSGEEIKVPLSGTASSDTSLSEEDKKRLEQERSDKAVAARNKALTDSISGNSSEKTDLQAQYSSVKAQKGMLQAEFNNLHNTVTGEYHPDYSQKLQTRAKKGWRKLSLKDVFTNSGNILTGIQTALKTGDFGSLNFLPAGMTDKGKITTYLSGKEFDYNKQNMVDAQNYEAAAEEFRAADEATDVSDRVLTDAIDAERSLVDEMRVKDAQMRSITIAQGYLA